MLQRNSSFFFFVSLKGEIGDSEGWVAWDTSFRADDVVDEMECGIYGVV